MDDDDLAEYVDRTLKGESARFGAPSEELKNIVQKLRRTLILVTPSSTFKADLKERLLAYPLESPNAVPEGGLAGHSREIVLGAAVLSLAGAALLLWRSRCPGAESAVVSQAS